jgi:predicted RNA-binding Zn ribbon-like protein
MPDYLFLANELALDFVNTEIMLGGEPTDLLQNFANLAEWCGKAGLASASDMLRLAADWADTGEAKDAFQSARELRRVLRKSFEKASRTGRAPVTLAAVLNNRLKDPRLASEVLYTRGRLKTSPRWVLKKPHDLVVPVAQYAANFFATADYSAIRKCENSNCILFFYDTSKNHSRRWCSMNLCGNRAKVSAFRQRL